jgi:hypothetical protein
VQKIRVDLQNCHGIKNLKAEFDFSRAVHDQADCGSSVCGEYQVQPDWQAIRQVQEKFGAEEVTIRVLQKVILMTPESIHLNSFMCEPILGMSDEHLRRLFGDMPQL